MGKGKVPDYDNPQHMTTGILEFDDEKCTRCGTCTYPCVSASLKLPPKIQGEKRGVPYVEELLPGVIPCVACGDCVAACPRGAISIQRGMRINPPFFGQRLTQSTKLTYPRLY